MQVEPFPIGISLSVAVTSGVSQAGKTPAAKAAADGDVTFHPDLAFDVVTSGQATLARISVDCRSFRAVSENQSGCH